MEPFLFLCLKWNDEKHRPAGLTNKHFYKRRIPVGLRTRGHTKKDEKQTYFHIFQQIAHKTNVKILSRINLRSIRYLSSPSLLRHTTQKKNFFSSLYTFWLAFLSFHSFVFNFCRMFFIAISKIYFLPPARVNFITFGYTIRMR